MRRYGTPGIHALTVFTLIAVVLSGCGDDEYRAEIPIDEVVVADTVARGDEALVVFTWPIGCNRCPQLETSVRNDTIRCTVTLLFYDPGMPCAHGPIVDTCYMAINPAETGDYVIVYRDTAWATVAVPVTVVGP